MIADSLVEEIGCYFSKLVAENYINHIKTYLGDNWKEKIEKFYKLITMSGLGGFSPEQYNEIIDEMLILPGEK